LDYLTTHDAVVNNSNMKARELFIRRVPVTRLSFAELVMWEVPESIPGSTHTYKYRLVFVVAGVCVLRYDNETGKGDHRHVKGKELNYRFVAVDRLAADFFEDMKRWRDENSDN
jgi:hypothetical protein